MSTYDSFDVLVNESSLRDEFTNHQSRTCAPCERQAGSLRHKVSIVLGFKKEEV